MYADQITGEIVRGNLTSGDSLVNGEYYRDPTFFLCSACESYAYLHAFSYPYAFDLTVHHAPRTRTTRPIQADGTVQVMDSTARAARPKSR